MKNLLIAIVLSSTLFGCSRNDVVIEGDDLTEQALHAAEASGYKPSLFKKDILYIYSWEDYIAPHVLANFEKALNIKIIIDTFNSNEEMFNHLQSCTTKYDLITPSSYIINGMAKAGLIAKLNHRHLPNVRKNFDASFSHLLIDPRFTYNVPCSITYTGIHYDRSRLPKGSDPQDLMIFGNLELSGRTALFDDMRETLGIGLMSLGYSINATNPIEINAGVEQVIKWKKLAARFDDDIYGDDVVTGAVTIAMSYSDGAFQSIAAAAEAPSETSVQQGFTLPKSGFSIGVDEFVVGANAKNKALAYAFINYFYDAEVARSAMEATFLTIPVKSAINNLDPTVKKLINLTPDELARGQVIMDFSDRPTVEKLYEEAWERIRAAN